MTGPCGIHPGVAGEAPNKKDEEGDKHSSGCPQDDGQDLFPCPECGEYENCPNSTLRRRRKGEFD